MQSTLEAYNGSIIDVRPIGHKDVHIGYHGRGKNPRKRYPVLVVASPSARFGYEWRGCAEPMVGHSPHLRVRLWLPYPGEEAVISNIASPERAEHILIDVARIML